MLLWGWSHLLSPHLKENPKSPTLHLGCAPNPPLSQGQIPILFGPVPCGPLPLTLGLGTWGD